ncbi:hypothetical protein LP421_01420 (plasmid) [Rhizobium sp. RCAM05350]|nr:hypothetical protein LP421_01420 [Rhizobium sp. RCAM05350]
MMIREGLFNRILLWEVTIAGLIVIYAPPLYLLAGVLQSGLAARLATAVRSEPHMVCGAAE